MANLIKSILIVIAISILAFGVTCGGTFMLFFGWGALGIPLIIIGLVIIYKICRSYLGVYFWRYFGVSIITYIPISIVLSGVQYILMTSVGYRGVNTPVYYIIQLLSLFFVSIPTFYVFHFYRMKAQIETTAIGSAGEDISIIFGNIFRPFINFFRDIQKTPEETTFSGAPSVTEEKVIQTPEASTIKSESTDLMSSLGQVDITNISGITFFPKVGKGFQVKTPNIKRLTVYITTKLAKTTFEVEELRNIYNHVSKSLQSNLSKTDYNIVQGKINEFVQSGGEVKIEKYNP
ncbi:hypothetical protein HOO68_01610 [Candidatus Gracilibacteria bacterium]|nr:hypothetical protein [Candidatus Gracilibacteria bacterium]